MLMMVCSGGSEGQGKVIASRLLLIRKDFIGGWRINLSPNLQTLTIHQPIRRITIILFQLPSTYS